MDRYRSVHHRVHRIDLDEQVFDAAGAACPDPSYPAGWW